MSEQNQAQTDDDPGKPPPRWVFKLFTRINVIVYKLSSGRLMNDLSGMPIVLITMNLLMVTDSNNDRSFIKEIIALITFAVRHSLQKPRSKASIGMSIVSPVGQYHSLLLT